MAADASPLPFRTDWNTNCVPYEAFLGPHPAVGGGAMPAALMLPQPAVGGGQAAAEDAGAATEQRRRLAAGAPWLGGACWLGFRTPPQLRALAAHFAPLTFVASEGPLPDVLPLDALSALGTVTMLRQVRGRLAQQAWARCAREAAAGRPLLRTHQQPACSLMRPRLTGLMPPTAPRQPLDRALSSYRWWRLMLERMPQSPGAGRGARLLPVPVLS